MKVVRPIAVTEASLTASNVPEDDAPAWTAGTYNTGNQVIRNHHVYESVADGNTATPGAETTAPLKWQDLGATNRWRMFDKKAGNKWLIGKSTENADSIDVTIDPNRTVSAVGLVGVDALSVRVIMTDPVEGVVYDRTEKMTDTGVMSWYDYFFAPFEHRDNLALTDLPAYGTADVQVIANAPGATARIGMMVIGSAVDIGCAIYGTGLGIDSYSLTTEDDFGNVTIIPRGSKRIVDFDLRIDTDQISMVMRLLDSLRDVPSLYIADGNIDATIILGRFERLDSVISSPSISEMSLEIRSLQ